MVGTAKQEVTEKTLPARWHLPIPVANKLGCRSRKLTSIDCVLAKGEALLQHCPKSQPNLLDHLWNKQARFPMLANC